MNILSSVNFKIKESISLKVIYPVSALGPETVPVSGQLCKDMYSEPESASYHGTSNTKQYAKMLKCI